MLNRKTQYQEWLLPYLEGGLDEARRARLEARLGEDPALAAEAERLRRTLVGLRGAAARTPRPESAQVPADLWPHLRARLVLDPAPRLHAPRAWRVAAVGVPAAAALVVAAFWLPVWHTPELRQDSPAPIARRQAPSPKAATPAVPAHPPSGMPAPALKPQPAVKPRMAVPTPAPAPAVAHPTPFDLPPPTPPAGRSAKGPSAPFVPVPSGHPVADAARPPVSPARVVAATHRSAAAGGHPAAPLAVAPSPAPMPAPPPAAPKLALPQPTPTAATSQGASPPAPAPSRATATAGMGGGAATPGAADAPKEAAGMGGSAPAPAKPPPNAAALPGAAMFGQLGSPPRGTRRNKSARRTPDRAGQDQASGRSAQDALDSWQSALSAAVRPPLWGDTEGEAQASQALMAARESGMLDDLRARLEARRAQSPRDVVTGRMLAAVYDFGFSRESALRERRRVSALEGADGEDWYALAQAEGRAGNGAAARAAYRRALESPIPPPPFHAAIARGRS